MNAIDINTIKRMIRQESPARFELGRVVAVDPRGTRYAAVRLSGGRVCNRCYMGIETLEVGDQVLVAHIEGLDRILIVAHILDEYASSSSKRGILAPPGNMAVTAMPWGHKLTWDHYPGADVCYQIQHNDSAAEAGATLAMITRGGYYLYHIVDEDADDGAPTARYFRVRSIRWISDSNMMYSGWSVWVNTTSVTLDGRYRTETELASTANAEGASMIGIEDAGGIIVATDVEAALQEIAAAASELPDAGNAANVLVDDGADWQSVAMSGEATIAADGTVEITKVPDAGQAGDLLVDDGAAWAREAMSGDASIVADGTVTVGKIHGRDVQDAAPTNAQVLTWSTANNRWEPADATGAGGGNPIFRADGAIVVSTDVDGAYIVSSDATIEAVYLYLATAGSASTIASTIVDVHKNGATIFTNQDNRPTLAWDDADHIAKSGTPDVTTLVENDILTVDIDQAAVGAANIAVVIALTSSTGGNISTIEIQEDDVKTGDALILNFEGGINTLDEGNNKVTVTISGGLYNAYVHVRDKKAQGTNGGTFTTGAWQTRDITEEQADAAAICSIAANQITLEAGTYRCLISCPAHRVNHHQARLQNITDATTLLVGSSEYARNNAYDSSRSFVAGRFTLAAQKVLEIQHYCGTTVAANGFGLAINFTDEIYTLAEFWRET